MPFVYAIRVDGVVRYVGKGTRYRPGVHLTMARRVIAGRQCRNTLSFHHRLADALLAGSSITHEVLANNLTNAQALDLEAKEIAARSGLWNVCQDARGGESFRQYHKTERAAETRRRNGIEVSSRPDFRAAKSQMMSQRMATPEGKASIAASNKRRAGKQTAATLAALAEGRKHRWENRHV